MSPEVIDRPTAEDTADLERWIRRSPAAAARGGRGTNSPHACVWFTNLPFHYGPLSSVSLVYSSGEFNKKNRRKNIDWMMVGWWSRNILPTAIKFWKNSAKIIFIFDVKLVGSCIIILIAFLKFWFSLKLDGIIKNLKAIGCICHITIGKISYKNSDDTSSAFL